MVYSISRGISRGLQIFRLLPRPSAMTTAYWRCKERVYFGGLEMGLEKAVSIQVTSKTCTTELNKVQK